MYIYTQTHTRVFILYSTPTPPYFRIVLTQVYKVTFKSIYLHAGGTVEQVTTAAANPRLWRERGKKKKQLKKGSEIRHISQFVQREEEEVANELALQM